MKKHLIFIGTFILANAAFAITATKAYVDRATNVTLTAAKAYADTISGMSPAAATNITVTNIKSSKPVKIGNYLWEIGTEGENWEKARERLMTVYPSWNPGSCTGVANTRYHGRNLDWEYDFGCSVVVRSPAGENKYGVLGLAGGIKKFTDEFMMSEAWDTAYYTLPFTLTDGMNDQGVVIQQNVLTKDTAKSSAWRSSRSGCVIAFAMIRYALDRCGTAIEAANMIKEKLFVPNEFAYDIHYHVSDRTSAYIVEDAIVYSDQTVPTDIMTNFRIGGRDFNGIATNSNGTVRWDSVEDFGVGLERYDRIRTNGFDKSTIAGMTGTMTNAWYTQAYEDSTVPYWYTEFCEAGTSLTVMNALTNQSVFAAVRASEHTTYTNEHDKAGSQYRGGQSWQTTHTAIYDKDLLMLRLYVQEDYSSERTFYLVKDRESSAASPAPSLEPATNYTDSATNYVYAAATNDASAKYLPWVVDMSGNRTAVTIGSRYSGLNAGAHSFVSGENCVARGNYSFAGGFTSYATGTYSHAEGYICTAYGFRSFAVGSFCKTTADSASAAGIGTLASNEYSYVWQGDRSDTYGSHGDGTFNINPYGGLTGFYVGETNVGETLAAKRDHSDRVWTAAGSWTDTKGYIAELKSSYNTGEPILMQIGGSGDYYFQFFDGHDPSTGGVGYIGRDESNGWSSVEDANNATSGYFYSFYGSSTATRTAAVNLALSTEIDYTTNNTVLVNTITNLAPKSLSGNVYDFANGSNFTLRLYTALTNVILTLGGSVTNAPTL